VGEKEGRDYEAPKVTDEMDMGCKLEAFNMRNEGRVRDYTEHVLTGKD
jgi:hypothetical protein